jgi:hypothetical protein
MEIERKTKEEVKAYYIDQLGKFFAKIDDIPDNEIKGLPAVHIPSLGFTAECLKLPFMVWKQIHGEVCLN